MENGGIILQPGETYILNTKHKDSSVLLNTIKIMSIDSYF